MISSLPFAPDERGFTLIEMMAVMVLMAVLAAVTIPALGDWAGSDVKDSASKMASLLRSIYEEATIKRVPMRLAVNLDRGTYWVEEAAGEARIFTSEEDRKAADERAKLDEEERTELLDAQMRERDAQEQSLAEAQPADSSPTSSSGLGGLLSGLLGGSSLTTVVKPYEGINKFTALEDSEWGKPQSLADDVHFLGAWTPAFDDIQHPTEEGPPEKAEDEVMVYIHVFPSGYIEDAIVQLAAGENSLSVVTDPLTGRARVEDGEVDPRSLRREEREVEQ